MGIFSKKNKTSDESKSASSDEKTREIKTNKSGGNEKRKKIIIFASVSYTHLTLPTTPYV